MRHVLSLLATSLLLLAGFTGCASSGGGSNGGGGGGASKPTISTINPNSGAIGTSIIISGTNFGATQGSSTITFSGTPGTATAWSTASITVPVPSGATTGNVIVTVGGSASNGVAFTVAPNIATLSPNSGPLGTSVVIAGTGFGSTQGSSTVTFNGTAATPSAWTATSITVPVPAAATTGNVVVTVGGTASNGVSFTVGPAITSLNPTSGVIAAAITITGTSFGATQGTSTVTFSGLAGTPSSWSATSIVVPVPAGATTGNVVVTVGGSASNGVAFTVAPNIATLSPNSGPLGTSVVIAGTGFGSTQGSSTVTFNGTAATPSAWTATSITVPVPAAATTGNVAVTVGGTASNSVNFTVTPGITSLNPTSGAIGTAVTITGTNFGATQGSSTVTFNGIAAVPTSWSATSITTVVPVATTGNVVVTVGGVASNAVIFTVTPPGAPISDDFHGTTLNPMWTFFAGCCGYAKMNGNDVQLIVPSVTDHNIFSQNHGVGLLQNISNVDFEVEAKFDAPVTKGDQEEGILVQQDASNFMYFGTYHDGTTPHVYAIVTAGGTGNLPYDQAITQTGAGAPFYIRLTRTGSTWTQKWSTDGVNYSVGAQFSQTITTNAIGPAAGNTLDVSSDPAPSFTALVDYFINTASPLSSADGGTPQPPDSPVFDVWYGDNQNFGKNGIPQRWVNVLGTVTAPSGIKSASYTLNGGAPQFLRVGPSNSTRLVDTGDFNVEIDHAVLSSGANTVVITAVDNNNHSASHTVTVNWNYVTGKIWPLPYSIDWSTATNIQDVAQIPDGRWAIQPDGSVRTQQTGYDRIITLGDETWTDYVVTAEMTINQLDCTQFGAGLAVGWSGATNDPTQPQPDQPGTGHPFFGLGWDAVVHSDTIANQQLNIYANSVNHPEEVLVSDFTFRPTLGLKYIVKFQVQRNPSPATTSHYSLKIWPASAAEPANWNLQADSDASTGSVVLETFNSDVSFGKINVVALP